MFGLGWQEILVIIAIGVMVIGPDQLPQVARTIGKLMAQFRRATSDLRDAVNEEVHQHQELTELKEFSSNLENEVREFGTSTQEYLEKEIENEEQELEKLGREIADDVTDATDAPPPADIIPTEAYGPILNDPSEEATADSTAEAADSTAVSGDEGTSETKPDTAHKETDHKETA